ncbi:uncharacterized protein CDAR_55611 [Caerostris darwini]|uniref:Uncharacterized protein n=1 Tax=Caerostris darwini TaxID=1538125 RepID=A0AAV4W277_9ARAC|nr:uncharacterized protein CDAR_55611 [Caerostris darwini]
MSSSNYDDYSSSPPRMKRRGKKDIFKVPENTISDMSAYMANYREKLEKNLEGDEGTSSEQSSSYDSSYDRQPPPRRVIPDSPNSTRVQMVEDFIKHAEESDNWLEKWYSENYEKVNHYDILRFELLYLLGEYLPGLKVNEDIHPNALIATIKEFVIDLYTKFNKFNLELREISGHEVAGYIHDHQRKVIEVVEDYESLLLTANEEIAQCKDQIAHLDAELAAALKKIQGLGMGTAFYGGYESVDEEQFMADLQSRVARSDSLNSSMKEELVRERNQNAELQRQLKHYAKEKVVNEEKCMRDIVEFSRRAEVNSMLEEGLKSMFQKQGEKDPNPQDCQRLINNWKKEINQAIDQNSKEIDELLKRIDGQNNDITKLQAKSQELQETSEELDSEIKRWKGIIEINKAEIQKMEIEIQKQNEYINKTEEHKNDVISQQDFYSLEKPTSIHLIQSSEENYFPSPKFTTPKDKYSHTTKSNDKTFSQQSPESSTRYTLTNTPQNMQSFNKSEFNEGRTFSPHQNMNAPFYLQEEKLPCREVDLIYSPEMDPTHSETDYSYSRGTTPLSRKIKFIDKSLSEPPRTIIRQSRYDSIHSPKMDHTYSNANHPYSSVAIDSIPDTNVPLAPRSTDLPPAISKSKDLKRIYPRNSRRDSTHSSVMDRTYSGIGRSDSFDADSFDEDAGYGCQFLMRQSPDVDLDEHLEDNVFEGRTWPKELSYKDSLDNGYNRHLTRNRDDYTGFLPSGADNWDEAKKDIIQERRTRSLPYSTSPERMETAPQTSVRFQQVLTLSSPKRNEPIHLNIEVAPKSISHTPSGEHVICDISVIMSEAAFRSKTAANKSIVSASRQPLKINGTKSEWFTPKGVFERNHYKARKLFKNNSDVNTQEPLSYSSSFDTDFKMERNSPRNRKFNKTSLENSNPTPFSRSQTFNTADNLTTYQTPYANKNSDERAFWTTSIKRNKAPSNSTEDILSVRNKMRKIYPGTSSRRNPQQKYPGNM